MAYLDLRNQTFTAALKHFRFMVKMKSWQVKMVKSYFGKKINLLVGSSVTGEDSLYRLSAILFAIIVYLTLTKSQTYLLQSMEKGKKIGTISVFVELVGC